MIKIRQGIFETNSSSSHSFSIGKTSRFNNTLPIDDGGVISVESDSYGSVKKTNDAYMKLSFLIDYIYTLLDDPYADKKEGTHSDGYLEVFKIISETVCNFTGAKELKANPYTEVDHQSMDMIDRRDLYNPEFIKEFVFNENSWLYLLWDSESPEIGFYENGEDEVFLDVYFELPGLEEEEHHVQIPFSDIVDEGFDWKFYDYFNGIHYNPRTQRFTRDDEDDLYHYIGKLRFGKGYKSKDIVTIKVTCIK